MTHTPETQESLVAESPVLTERLNRVHNALVELGLARRELKLKEFSLEELGAAYVETRTATRTSRMLLNELPTTKENGGETHPDREQRFVEWSAGLDVMKTVRGAIHRTAQENANEIGVSIYHAQFAGENHIQKLDDQFFDGRDVVQD